MTLKSVEDVVITDVYARHARARKIIKIVELYILFDCRAEVGTKYLRKLEG